MPDSDFQLEEATIDQLHAALKAGHITLVQVVQHYLKRVRAFNGVSSMLVTADGKDVHLRLSQKLALALNVEHGRLKGWLRAPAAGCCGAVPLHLDAPTRSKSSVH